MGLAAPALLPGYYSSRSEPLLVYRCFSEDGCSCPGGLPGNCTGGRSGKSCAVCADGMARTRCGCSKCGPGHKALLGIVLCALPIGGIALHVAGRSQESFTAVGSTSTSAACLTGIVVTILQTLALTS